MIKEKEKTIIEEQSLSSNVGTGEVSNVNEKSLNDAFLFQEKMAKKIVNNPNKVKRVITKSEKLYKKLLERFKGFPKPFDSFVYIPIFISLIKDWITKKYREVPFGIILGVFAGLLYLIAPIDIINDLTPVIGYVDDAIILAGCVSLFKDDLDQYNLWKNDDISKTIVEKKDENILAGSEK